MTARVTFREEGGEIEFDRLGKLTSPVAIAAFEGWNDAGEAASGVISHLGIAWQAQPIAAVEPEDFYDFQVTRPVVEITEGRIERLVWPTTRLSVARAVAWPESAGVSGSASPESPEAPARSLRDADPDGGDPGVPGVSADPGDDDAAPAGTGLDRDIILVHGIEPNMRWRSFTDELVQGLAELGVESVILLGALLADAPHTRPVPVSVGAADPKLSATVTAPFSDSHDEVAVRDSEDDPDSLDEPLSDQGSLVQAGPLLLGLDSLGIGTPVIKLQRVGRPEVREPILVSILIQELGDSLDGCHGEMVVALGANLVVLVHLLAKERGAAPIAAQPNSFRYPF